MKDGSHRRFQGDGKKCSTYFMPERAHTHDACWCIRAFVIGVPSEITRWWKSAPLQGLRRLSATAPRQRSVYLVEQADGGRYRRGAANRGALGKTWSWTSAAARRIIAVYLHERHRLFALGARGPEMKMDEPSLKHFLKRKYNLLVGERTAGQIKMEIGSAIAGEDADHEVKGRKP